VAGLLTSTVGHALLGAVVHLDGRPRYVHSGWFLISYANLAVVVAMIVVFALAIAIPFPRDRNDR
jgi:hypothetical protein